MVLINSTDLFLRGSIIGTILCLRFALKIMKSRTENTKIYHAFRKPGLDKIKSKKGSHDDDFSR